MPAVLARLEQSRIGRQIDFRAIVARFDDEPRKAGTLPDVLDAGACRSKGAIDGGHEPVDRGRGQTEVVEIARLTVDLPTRNQCRSAGECEVFSFCETGDDLGDLPLEGAQHLVVESGGTEPLRAGAAN